MAKHGSTAASRALTEPVPDELEPPALDVLPGEVIADRYRLERRIGAGGMATVWEATHLALHRPVAVKFVHIGRAGDPELRERFLREARVAAAVRHPNVVDILDFGTTAEGRPFMVMERLVGRSLGDRLASAEPLPWREAVEIAVPLLAGLAAVHEAGIVHRDLKPENVFLAEDASGVVPKVLDFGVSKAVQPRGELRSVLPTIDNLIVGTPQYMSPEQARGLARLDHRSDLFAAGVILYEMLSGELPFDAEAPGDVIIRIATEDPPDLLALQPDLPERLADVVRRAMQREPDDRYPSASAMQAALLDVLASPDDPDRDEPTAPWSPRPHLPPREALARDRSLGLRGGLLALLAGGLIALGLTLWATSDVEVPAASEPPADPHPPRALVVEPADTLARVPVPRGEEPARSEEPAPAGPQRRETRPAPPPRPAPVRPPPPPRAEGLLRDPGF